MQRCLSAPQFSMRHARRHGVGSTHATLARTASSASRRAGRNVVASPSKSRESTIQSSPVSTPARPERRTGSSTSLGASMLEIPTAMGEGDFDMYAVSLLEGYTSRRQRRKHPLWTTFQQYDKDGDGQLNRGEFSAMFQDLGVPADSPNPISRHRRSALISKQFKDAGIEANRAISFDEFVDFHGRFVPMLDALRGSDRLANIRRSSGVMDRSGAVEPHML